VTYTETLLSSLEGMSPDIFIFSLLPMIPFIIAERIWPVGQRPRLRDYGMNISISLSTACLSLPLGVAAAVLSARLRHALSWHPLAFTFHDIGAVPTVGPVLELLAMILVPLAIRDSWHYWAHRLEHRVSLLWEFHRIHHSDENMNTSTWARDNFLQESWRTFFAAFTLGLIFDLDLKEAGKAAFYSNLFLICLSMFYHSSIRVQLRWLDPIIVTPQLHRIHHAVDPAYHNKNFADTFPIFDILFGTYRRPEKAVFPATGLGPAFPAPKSLRSAQFGPLIAVGRAILQMMRGRRLETS
jgi:sterol desaturase/sphingolipid hydroxylase (fatty acid hydroxylase superfamily)